MITIFFFGGGGELLPLKYPRQNPFVGFTCIIAFQIILQQCCKTSCTFLLPVLRSLNHYSYKELIQLNDFNIIINLQVCSAPYGAGPINSSSLDEDSGCSVKKT